jgi:hypothetical protein
MNVFVAFIVRIDHWLYLYCSISQMIVRLLVFVYQSNVPLLFVDRWNQLNLSLNWSFLINQTIVRCLVFVYQSNIRLLFVDQWNQLNLSLNWSFHLSLSMDWVCFLSLSINRSSSLCWSMSYLSLSLSLRYLSLPLYQLIPLFIDQLNVFVIFINQSSVHSIFVDWSIPLCRSLASDSRNESRSQLIIPSLFINWMSVCCLYWSIILSLSINTYMFVVF